MSPNGVGWNAQCAPEARLFSEGERCKDSLRVTERQPNAPLATATVQEPVPERATSAASAYKARATAVAKARAASCAVWRLL
jgi:hypothetical protein